jgi:MarR family transcriptional regulator, negative regulator of the multidrug operon emrRAB
MHDVARTANLLGATGLAIRDLALSGAAKAAGVSESGAAALVVLSGSPGLSVTELGRRIGLSQPAAARMVDSLVAAALARRSPGSGRAVEVRLTPSGQRAVRRLLAARRDPLVDLVNDALSNREQAALDGLLEKVLTNVYGEVGDADRVCRLCDRASCTRNAVCPVGEAERRRER